ncbi:hypothetical protein HAX54_024563 [Datura stramonium]|uniref:Uncharacterized protein n=1 Tax=Datura stramonium TaxID=4076 RepID=A0ABS8V0A2_DATST|nr:hypothetical protein [Datura stramonium]
MLIKTVEADLLLFSYASSSLSLPPLFGAGCALWVVPTFPDLSFFEPLDDELVGRIHLVDPSIPPLQTRRVTWRDLFCGVTIPPLLMFCFGAIPVNIVAILVMYKLGRGGKYDPYFRLRFVDSQGWRGGSQLWAVEFICGPRTLKYNDTSIINIICYFNKYILPFKIMNCRNDHLGLRASSIVGYTAHMWPVLVARILLFFFFFSHMFSHFDQTSTSMDAIAAAILASRNPFVQTK